MSNKDALQSLEHQAYTRVYSDGIIDLFVGISLMWIGFAWIWLPDFAGLAGVLPAVFVPVAMTTRKKFVEDRIGYVQWSEPRRNKVRRNLIIVFAAGVVLFLGGVVAFFVVDQSLANQDVLDFIMPGLLAWLLALLALGLAILMDAWRFLIYAAVLAIAGLITALEGANPGWPLLAAGVVITIAGLVLLYRFTQANPKAEAQ